MTDFFAVKKTKQELLIEWMRARKRFNTSQLIKWSIDNYFISANRRKQELEHAGKIRMLTEYEKFSYGFLSKDSAYQWVGE